MSSLSVTVVTWIHYLHTLLVKNYLQGYCTIAMWIFAWTLECGIINSKEKERKDYRIHKKHAVEIQTGTQCVIKIKYGT